MSKLKNVKIFIISTWASVAINIIGDFILAEIPLLMQHPMELLNVYLSDIKANATR